MVSKINIESGNSKARNRLEIASLFVLQKLRFLLRFIRRTVLPLSVKNRFEKLSRIT